MLKEANGYALSRRHLTEYLTDRGIKFVRQEHGPEYLREMDAASVTATGPDARLPQQAADDVPHVTEAPEPVPVVTGPGDTGWLTVTGDGVGSATMADDAQAAGDMSPTSSVDEALSRMSSHLRQVADDMDVLRSLLAEGGR